MDTADVQAESGSRPVWPTFLAIGVTVAVLGAMLSMLIRGRPAGAYYDLYLLNNGPSAIVLLWMSRLVLRRRPGHGAGLVLLAIGLVEAFHTVVAALADARLAAAGYQRPLSRLTEIVPADLPLDAAIPLWAMAWCWVPAPVLAIAGLPLVFPDGRLLSARWRPVAALAAAGAALLMTAFAIDAWPGADWTSDQAPTAVGALVLAGGLSVLAAGAGAIVALAIRWRSADPMLRGPFRAVAVAAIAFVLSATIAYPWQAIWTPLVLVTFTTLVVVYALAVSRYRLHDVEPTLGRDAVAALSTGLAIAAYLLAVVGIGLVAWPVDRFLALAVVAVLALLVEPLRRAVGKLLEHALYRRRADRAEVLSQLARGAGAATTTADVVAEVADLVVRGSGARRVEIWLDGRGSGPAAAAGAAFDGPPVLTAAVEHRGERFGELWLYARAAADLVGDAPQLAGDVANALGLVLRNERLADQLGDQLGELRASRERLVVAQHAARRGLERDIHDGAQARLVGLRLRLGALRARSGAEDPITAEDLDALEREVDRAIRSLRELARGLHPPLLEQAGPVEALRAHIEDLPVDVSLEADAIGRHPRAVEGAVYFACLEAVQNAIRHGGATEVRIQFSLVGGTLRCCIQDDGAGFDSERVLAGTGLANIGDRASALGGELQVDTRPGRGTRVVIEIPSPS